MNNINSGNIEKNINMGDAEKIGNDINSKILNIYKKTSYLEKYGGSVFMVAMLMLFYTIYRARLDIKNRMGPIKDDWANKRCSPDVIPFAGMINTPPGSHPFLYTASNFSYCIRNILSGIVFDFFAPIYFVVGVIEQVIRQFVLAIKNIKVILEKIQETIAKIIQYIRDTLNKFVSPFKKILYSVIDAFSKIGGLFQALVFMFIAVLNSCKAFIAMTLMNMVIAITVLCVLVGILWAAAIFFPIPTAFMAKALTLTIVTNIAILTAIITIVRNILGISVAAVMPLVPACFDENTMFKLHDGTSKRIIDIKIGDKLQDGGIVTGKIKHLLGEQKMYKINGVYVTDKHIVVVNDGLDEKHVKVEDHPDSILVDDYNKYFIYCLNTTSKRIIINNVTFTDWDDLDEMDMLEIKTKCNEQGMIEVSKESIHKNIDGGFHGSTQIQLEDGRSIPIKDIDINDILICGERVTGLVEIDGLNVSKQYKFKFKDDSDNDVEIFGGPNLVIFDDESLGVMQTIDIVGKKVAKEEKLYHIITDKRTLQINGIKFLDYNSCVELYLENDKDELFSGLL